MKKRDGKREEENVTLFFNQSGRRLIFIFFNMGNNFNSISFHIKKIIAPPDESDSNKTSKSKLK